MARRVLYDSGPYTAYLVMNGVTSNSVNFGPAPPPPTTTTTTAPPPTTTATPIAPPPTGSLVYPIANAAGGIYYRSSPHWSDTPQTPGVGVFDGDRVRLICGSQGEPVGPYSNTAWSYVTNLSRSVGNGWVNEHYINDGAPANGFVAGEPACDSSIPGVPGVPSGFGGGGSIPPGSSPPRAGNGPCYQTDQSVFYSPTDHVSTGLSGVHPAQCNLDPYYWKNSSCDSGATVRNTPANARILSGWSYGRIGPLLYLAGTPRDSSQWYQIQTIVLFDPGNYNNFTYPACDGRISPPISSLLDQWLKQSDTHHLLILAGDVTEDRGFLQLGSATYHGLWHYYLPDIWAEPRSGPQSVSSRVLICDYSNFSHADVLEQLAWVAQSPPTTCPYAPVYIATGVGPPVDIGPTGWHP